MDSLSLDGRTDGRKEKGWYLKNLPYLAALLITLHRTDGHCKGFVCSGWKRHAARVY